MTVSFLMSTHSIFTTIWAIYSNHHSTFTLISCKICFIPMTFSTNWGTIMRFATIPLKFNSKNLIHLRWFHSIYHHNIDTKHHFHFQHARSSFLALFRSAHTHICARIARIYHWFPLSFTLSVNQTMKIFEEIKSPIFGDINTKMINLFCLLGFRMQ